MALISAITALFAFYGPRVTTTKLASLRKTEVGGSCIGFIFSLGTSAAPLLLLLSVDMPKTGIDDFFVHT